MSSAKQVILLLTRLAKDARISNCAAFRVTPAERNFHRFCHLEAQQPFHYYHQHTQSTENRQMVERWKGFRRRKSSQFVDKRLALLARKKTRNVEHRKSELLFEPTKVVCNIKSDEKKEIGSPRALD